MKVVIPAAGEGTRFRPLSRVVPKELFPLGDRPVIQYVVSEAVDAGAENVLIVTSSRKQAISEYFKKVKTDSRTSPVISAILNLQRIHDCARLTFVIQSKPTGLADAIYTARNLVGDEPFGCLVADTIHGTHPPVLTELVSAYERLGAPDGVLAVHKVGRQEVRRYGVIVPGYRKLGCTAIQGVVEKPAPEASPSRMAITGAYYFGPKIFQSIKKTRSAGPDVAHLARALTQLADGGEVYALPVSRRPVDVGDLELWRAANLAWSPKDPFGL